MMRQIVIIPGWGGTRKSWDDFIELAKNDFEIYFIDMPCFGDVTCPETIWGVDDFANFVKNKVEEQCLDMPFLLGHSFGGQVAVNLVGNNPQMFAGLILSGAAVLRPKKIFRRVIFSGIAKFGKFVLRIPGLNSVEKLARKILYKVADSPDYDKTDGVKREIFKKVIRQSQQYLLGNISVPTLLVWGSADSYVPLSEGKKLAKMISNAQIEIIKGGRHGLHIQQPENLLNIVKGFIEQR